MKNLKGITQRPSTWLIAAALVFGTSFAVTANPGAKSPSPRPLLNVTNAQYSPTAAPSTTGNLHSIEELDKEFSSLAAQISPSVVHIRSGSESTPGSSQGSGVIFRADGWIVTNDHVVDGASEVTVILSNGREYKGKVTRSGDARNDIALVKIDANNLQAAPFAESHDVKTGQFAVAVGSPFGLENTVTIGHVSAIGRNNIAGGGMAESYRYYNSMIQTDASINPGNSGGPLLNIKGEVIGINTSILSGGTMMGGGGSVGVGFAIPSNQAKLVAEILISKGKLVRGYLGLAPETIKPFEREEMKIDGGARVADLPPTGPAYMGGLRKNDIILSIGSENVLNDQDLLNTMLKYGPGSDVDIEYMRGTEIRTAKIKVGTFPKELTQQTIPNDRNGFDNNPNNDDMQKQMEELRKQFGRNGGGQLLNPNDGGGMGDQGTGKIERAPKGSAATLGVSIANSSDAVASEYFVPKEAQGAIVTNVEPGSLASEVGLKVGDVINQIGDTKVTSAAELVKAIKTFKVGDRTNISFSRYGKSSQSTMMLPIQF